MSKHIIAVNAGPRKGWNTDTLITGSREGRRIRRGDPLLTTLTPQELFITYILRLAQRLEAA